MASTDADISVKTTNPDAARKLRFGALTAALSPAIGAAKLDMDFRLVSPRALWPGPGFLNPVRDLAATSRDKFQVLDDVATEVGAEIETTFGLAAIGG
jgi:ornithine carbamoyltransferase